MIDPKGHTGRIPHCLLKDIIFISSNWKLTFKHNAMRNETKILHYWKNDAIVLCLRKKIISLGWNASKAVSWWICVSQMDCRKKWIHWKISSEQVQYQMRACSELEHSILFFIKTKFKSKTHLKVRWVGLGGFINVLLGLY